MSKKVNTIMAIIIIIMVAGASGIFIYFKENSQNQSTNNAQTNINKIPTDINRSTTSINSTNDNSIKRICEKKIDKFKPYSIGYCGDLIRIIPLAEDAGYYILDKEENIIQWCANYGTKEMIENNPKICKQKNCSEYICRDYVK